METIQRNEDLMTYQELSRYLNIPLATVYQLKSKGRLPFLKLSGRIIRFSKTRINQWIGQQAIEPNQQEG